MNAYHINRLVGPCMLNSLVLGEHSRRPNTEVLQPSQILSLNVLDSATLFSVSNTQTSTISINRDVIYSSINQLVIRQHKLALFNGAVSSWSFANEEAKDAKVVKNMLQMTLIENVMDSSDSRLGVQMVTVFPFLMIPAHNLTSVAPPKQSHVPKVC